MLLLLVDLGVSRCSIHMNGLSSQEAIIISITTGLNSTSVALRPTTENGAFYLMIG